MRELTKKDLTTCAIFVLSFYAYWTAATNTDLELLQFLALGAFGIIGLTLSIREILSWIRWPVSRRRYADLEFDLEMEAGWNETLIAVIVEQQGQLKKYQRPRNEKGQFVREEA